MRKILITIMFMLLLISVYAFEMVTDFELACKQAEKQGKKVLIIFRGSDWCSLCMSMEERIWSSQEFDKFANGNCIVLNVDFPKLQKNKLTEKQFEKNKSVYKRYNTIKGLPLTVLLDEHQEILGTIPYTEETVGDYINQLKSFQLKKKALKSFTEKQN